MQKFRDQGKILDDAIGHIKTILCYVKKPEGATDKNAFEYIRKKKRGYIVGK